MSLEPHPSNRKWTDRLSSLRNIPEFLRMVWATSPILFVTSVGLRAALACCQIGQVYIASLLITRVVQVATHGVFHGWGVWRLVVFEVGIVGANEWTSRVVSLTDNLLGDKFTNHSSLKLMAHALTLDFAYFEDPIFHDKLERARRQTTSRLAMIVVLATTFQYLIMLVLFSGSIAVVSPWLLLLLCVGLIPAFIGENHFAALSYSLLYQWTPARRQLDYLRFLATNNSSIKEIKIFGLGQYLLRQSASLFDRFYYENKVLSIRRMLYGTGLGFIPKLAYYGGYIYLVKRVLQGAFTIGEFVFLATAFDRCRNLVEALFSNLITISDAAFQLGDLFDVFRTVETPQSKAGVIHIPRPIIRGIEFCNVTFRYPGSACDALTRLNLRIVVGDRVALVGENGAGKTTIVKLLARLYDPTDGAILLDGIDLREYDINDLRHQIGVIFQDFVRYDMRVTENIGFGNVERLMSKRDIVRAAAKSRADEIIEELPNGYEQMLGRRFDGGVDLSGGQWQKIALARAYMRSAQIVILDEPTASLDPRAEYAAFQSFLSVTHGRTAVIISHRFSTVRMANHIAVVDGGMVVEQGTHENLLRLGGKYAELFECQAEAYR